MRIWFATAFLASAWLFGLGYFTPVHLVAWIGAVVVAVLLLGDVPVRLPRRGERGLALLLVLPALWLAPFPYCSMPILLSCGLLASLLPVRGTSMRFVTRGCLLASLILLPQALLLLGYQNLTARSHALPHVLAAPVAGILRLLGADVALDGTSLVLQDTGVTDRIAASWELLWDPATASVVAGGLVVLAYLASLRRHAPGQCRAFLRSAGVLLLVTLAWAPLRLALLVALVLQQQLRADVAAFPNVGQILVSSWVHAVLVCAWAVVLGRLVPLPGPRLSGAAPARAQASRCPARLRRRGAVLAAYAIAVAMLVFLYCWTPVGERKAGRVMVVERHSAWEPTTEPYGTEVYGEAGSYNYAAIYAYCSQYYDMSRLAADDPLDDGTLELCDVLIIKTPTARYAPEEVEAVVRFVDRGGSLLLIGDHTNVFNMNTYLNDIARHFGFTFRNDLLFRVGDPYRQQYRPPALAHPLLQHVPPMSFAVSCSIDPGSSRGSMVIRNVGLFNLPPAYQESNYHPQAEYRPYMEYGAWCQLWSTVFGRGKVLAFADSTLFSNFCVYQPGKTELFMSMVEWLNHHPGRGVPRNRALWILTALVACVLGCLGLREKAGAWILVLSVTWCAWSVAVGGTLHLHGRALPLPAKKQSLQHVVIDRSLSTVPLFTGAFADDPEGGGYGLLEQWIPRVGNYTSRRGGMEVLSGDALVVICPTLLPGPQFRDALLDWVQSGGRLLVFDTPDVEESTANSLLQLFGLTSIHNAADQEDEPLRLAEPSLETPLQAACEIQGGEPLAFWGEVPIAARTRFGDGWVTAVGFGSLFNDASMGYHWLEPPGEPQLQRYEILYALLRAALQEPPER